MEKEQVNTTGASGKHGNPLFCLLRTLELFLNETLTLWSWSPRVLLVWAMGKNFSGLSRALLLIHTW